jgi:TRAP-type C4-dicarboxylate transport system permease small subunit
VREAARGPLLTICDIRSESDRLKLLDPLARLCAILAGVLLTFITLMTCGSLIGRNTTGTTIVGDFELTAFASAAAIALFMPWCQARSGNIIVDFFTAKASARTNAALDRIGCFVLALVFALLAWRVSLGGLSAWNANAESQIRGFPEWVVHATMVPPLALTSLIALWQAVFGLAAQPHSHP